MPRPGTVTCSGTITATFTWQPSFPGESPPNVVLVKETSRATWRGDTGSASNGLGFPAVPDANGFGGTSSGVKWSVKNNPGQSFTWTCTPSASASTADPPVGPYADAAASVSYRIDVGFIQISLSGGIQSTTESRYLIGQKCRAEITSDSIPPLSINSYSWNVSGGDSFKRFYVSHSQATHLSAGYRDNLATPITTPTLKCHFAKNGTVTISCTVGLAVPPGDKPESGLSLSLSQQTTTELPVMASLTWDPAYTRMSLNNDYVYASSVPRPDPPIENDLGLKWYSAVTTPADFLIGQDYGYWRWVQLVTLSSTRVLNGTTQSEMSGNDEVGYFTAGLDVSYPYAPSEPDPPAAWPADGSQHLAFDRPARSLDAVASSYSVRDNFESFLMYKPPGVDSDWVTLRKMLWLNRQWSELPLRLTRVFFTRTLGRKSTD
jgi:hypothetical protein